MPGEARDGIYGRIYRAEELYREGGPGHVIGALVDAVFVQPAQACWSAITSTSPERSGRACTKFLASAMPIGFGAGKLLSAGAGAATKAARVQRAGTSTTAGSKSRKIAIGEDMQGRVIPEAQRLGADYYDSPPDLPPSQWMEHNRKWFNDRMDEGCTVIDCGPAPGRKRYPKPTSPYYQMELDEAAKRDYPLLRSERWGE
jgi:hypothetical protein